MRPRLQAMATRVSLASLIGITLLGGYVKLVLYSKEVVLYQNVGLTIPQIVAFGAYQLAGGLLLLSSKARLWGALTSTLSFTFSTLLAVAHRHADIALTLGVAVFIGSYVIYKEIHGGIHVFA